MITQVFRICDAYESGVGRGLSGRNESNPYPPESREAEAYRIGWQFGCERKPEREPGAAL